MKTLVTGGLGFVGSNLVDLLLKEGDDVYVIDNLSSESSSLEYKNPKAHYFIMDAFDILDSELKEKTFDRIFHLAAEARIQPSFDRPLDYLKSNIYATGQICEFARITNCKSLVYATRDFTHVEDICNGLISVSRGNWKGDNFDLGKGEPISILELARMWSDNIEFVPLRKNEGLHTKSDNRKTFEKTGWKAKHSLIDYINSIK